MLFPTNYIDNSHSQLPIPWTFSAPSVIPNKANNVRTTQQWGEFTKPLLLWKSNKYVSMCVCVSVGIGECVCACRCTGAGVCSRACNLPACKAHAPYCLRPLWLHHIFRHYLINNNFRKKLRNIKMCVLIFSTTFIWNTFHPKKNSARYCNKCEDVFM